MLVAHPIFASCCQFTYFSYTQRCYRSENTWERGVTRAEISGSLLEAPNVFQFLLSQSACIRKKCRFVLTVLPIGLDEKTKLWLAIVRLALSLSLKKKKQLWQTGCAHVVICGFMCDSNHPSYAVWVNACTSKCLARHMQSSFYVISDCTAYSSKTAVLSGHRTS